MAPNPPSKFPGVRVPGYEARVLTNSDLETILGYGSVAWSAVQFFSRL